MSIRLSKSRFQKGLQCEKALWLSLHAPELATPVNASKQAVFDQGTEVGRVAQGLFEGGVEVVEDHRHTDQAIETTERLIAEGARVLYEPAFRFDGVLVRVDILVRGPNGRWDLYEVKSSGRLKDEHLTDAAVQTYVVEGAGLPVGRTHVVHLNTGYVYPGGEYDLAQLFTVVDVTTRVRSIIPSVPGTLERFRGLLDGPEPVRRIGACCRTPYECDFTAYCHAFLPDEHPVTDLPYLSERALHRLLDQGITCIRDIPVVDTDLTLAQRATVEAVRAGEPVVDVDGLGRQLDRLDWPVCHLDFETVNPALPRWPGTRPYEPVPFQYSAHWHFEDGRHEHREFLHTGQEDPRPGLAAQLIRDLAGGGSVVHYTSFERRVLEGLRGSVPQHTDGITAILGRLFDLEAPIRRWTRHPDAAGRTSIKYVLPAWCPDLTYEGLAIADGQAASTRYLAAISGRLDPAEAERVFADLRAYCGLDTLAMVRLLDEMRRRTNRVQPSDRSPSAVR